MITTEYKNIDARCNYGQRHFYWHGKWIGAFGGYYICIPIGRYGLLSLGFGISIRSWHENVYTQGVLLQQLKPTRGIWIVNVHGQDFNYWQPLAIIREIIKVRKCQP